MANDEAPQSNQPVIPHADDGYTDGAIGPMYGTQRVTLSAKQLPHGGEEAHRDAVWVGIPWRMILVICGGVVVALVVFGVLVSLLAGNHSDPYAGDWHGRGVSLSIEKTGNGWDVSIDDGQWLHAVERNGQLVVSKGGTTLTIRHVNRSLVVTRAGVKPVTLVRR